MNAVSGQPLAGLRVVVTRAPGQASAMSERLVALGAEPVEVSTIAIEAPADGGAALRRAVQACNTGAYDRIAVASPNGARALLAALADTGVSVAALAPVACVGPSTARVLIEAGVEVDIVPDRSVAEGLVEAIGAPRADAERLLLVQAEVARTVLADGLTAAGWRVDRVVAYRTVDGLITAELATAAAACDLITFTSSSTVERFVRLAGIESMPPAVASIGPITSQTATELGVSVDVEADPHTLDGLIDAVLRWADEAAGRST